MTSQWYCGNALDEGIMTMLVQFLQRSGGATATFTVAKSKSINYTIRKHFRASHKLISLYTFICMRGYNMIESSVLPVHSPLCPFREWLSCPQALGHRHPQRPCQQRYSPPLHRTQDLQKRQRERVREREMNITGSARHIWITLFPQAPFQRVWETNRWRRRCRFPALAVSSEAPCWLFPPAASSCPHPCLQSAARN